MRDTNPKTCLLPSPQVSAAMRDTTKVLQRSRLPADSCPRPMGEPRLAAAAAAAGTRDQEAPEEEEDEGTVPQAAVASAR